MLRYLFGPIPDGFPAGNLRSEREAGRCITFGWSEGNDLTLSPGDTWETLCNRLPDGWRPDFVALYLSYARVLPCLWSAPVPVVGLAADWNFLWHFYRRCLHRCDLVLTDTAGVAALAREGITWAHAANLFGCGREFLDHAYPSGPRNIDVLFVANLHPAVQRERLPWLQRLARVGDRWRVVIRTGVFGDAYRELLGRARVLFNHSVRGECNMRVFEAAAAGALLFQEDGNLEIQQCFRPGEEYISFTADDLEARLAYYLEHEDERRQIAQAARAKVRAYEFARLWEGQLSRISEQWSVIEERAARRAGQEPAISLPLRLWEALSSSMGQDTTLLSDLNARLDQDQDPAALRSGIGLVTALTTRRNGRWTEDCVRELAVQFRAAWAADPRHLLAGLNLAEALALTGQPAEAAEHARAVLRALDELAPGEEHGLDEGHFPPIFDHFRVAWERAAWEHAGDPAGEDQAKRDLLRWRLHALIARVSDSLDDYRAAAALRPDMPPTQAALGCALGRAGCFAYAVTPLRAAVAGDPLDLSAARALFQTLKEIGDEDGQRALVADRRLLAQAAPQCVPVEPWFAAEPIAPADSQTRAEGAENGLHLETLMPEEFRERFGNPDTSRALCGYTPAGDTHIVLTLVAALRPRRIVEVGTALGQMTANLTEWSPDDATVFTLGTVSDLPSTGRPEQGCENPGRGDFGRFAGHFGKGPKVLFATADSLGYDFARLAPLDFAFVDGAHDFRHVLSDTRAVYRALRPGGCLVWHDFDSPVAWVEVRQAVAAAALKETVYHVAGSQVAFVIKQEIGPAEVSVTAPLSPRGRGAGGQGEGPCERLPASPPTPLPRGERREDEPLAIVWEGDQVGVHSLALVNRALCQRLLERGHDLSLRPLMFREELRVPSVPMPVRLAERCGATLPRPADVHVRQAWPPDFTPPPEGHLVLIQPWEFGSVPRSWVRPMTDVVDEVWAYTNFVRDCYLDSGVPADRVHVVPLGVDPARFHPGVTPAPLQTRKRFKFLFVGGTIHRKGIDLLLQAYAASFRKDDDVCLVIKDMGVGTFYQGQTAEQRIAAFRAGRAAPEIEYLDRTLTEDELAGLYVACDCLAHPYRGEGFGLPIAEAMACGLPVIVTGLGAALDYCGPEHGYRVPAVRTRFPSLRVGDLETVDYPWLAEPDVAALAGFLRHVYQHPDEARTKGAAGSAHIRSSFTWDHAGAVVERRLCELRGRPVRRLQGTRKPRLPDGALTVAGPPTAPVVPSQPVSEVPLGSRDLPPRASLCLMVRNEEANLPACLASVQGLFDDVVVVDTGSTDGTKEVARRYGARVFDFPWVNSFAAARNEGLLHARGRYVFWMDADDRLDPPSRDRFRSILNGLDGTNVAYVMECVCPPDPETATETVVDHVRLFPRHPQLRWDYRVHEQILPGLRQLGTKLQRADVVIRHVGYLDPALRRRKRERDLRLLELDRQERPDDPFVLFNLGSIFQEMGRTAEALAFLERSLQGSHVRDSIVHKLYALIAQCQRNLGRPTDALTTCEAGRLHYPHDVEILFQEALARQALGDQPGEEACWKRVLASRDRPLFGSIDTGLAGYKARHNLAVLYTKQGRRSEAETQWRTAFGERPDFFPAALGLADLFRQQGRWADLERLAQQVEARAEGAVPASVLRVHGLLACRQYGAVRHLIDTTLLRHPDNLRLWILRSHALLQEGRDAAAAEAALRRILELDPGNREARHNLAVLQRQLARAG